MSNPDSIAGASEHSQQAALLSLLPRFYTVAPELKWLHAIPNGGDRDMRTASNLKAEGVKPGVADLYLPVARMGYHGFYIEMKRPGKLSNVSSAQQEFADFVRIQGYLYAVFDNWRDAWHALCWYLNIKDEQF